jgi:hypothetical protein
MIDTMDVERMIQDLNNATNVETKLNSLKALKNAIIGNKKKKLLLAEMNAISVVTNILNTETNPDLLIQAAAALGSFGKCEENVNRLVESGAIASLLRHISHENLRVVETCVRSLKIIYERESVPAEIIFNGNREVIDSLVRLLTPFTNDSVNEVVASLLARCCRTEKHQSIIANAGGVTILSNLLFSSYPKVQEAALDAFSSLCKGNEAIGRAIMKQDRVITQILSLIKDKTARIRLLSAKCLANLNRDGVLQECLNSNEITMSVLPVLVKLMNDQGKIREEAPSVLANLVTGNEELQKAACDANAIAKLVDFLKDTSSSDTMKANTLNALAELCMIREEGRKALIESKVLSEIIYLTGNSNEQVKYSALLCLKGLSRANKQLRATLIEAGVASHLFNLIKDPLLSVQAQACAVIANIVLDFAPMKQYVLEKNGIEMLTAFTDSMDQTVRLNSVAALKNLVYFAETNIKSHVLKHLTIDKIFRLLDDELEIQETTLNLIRNLIHGETNILTTLTTGEAGSKLLDYIDRTLALARNNESDYRLIVQALYVLCNMAVYPSENKKALLSNKILKHLFSLIKHQNKEVRSAVVWTLINLTWNDDPNHDYSIQTLKQYNCEEKLEALLNDSEIEVRDRAKQCLEQISAKYQPSSNRSNDHEDESSREDDEDRDIEMRASENIAQFLSRHEQW